MSPADWTPSGAIAFWFKPTWTSDPTPGSGIDHVALRLYRASTLAIYDVGRVASIGKGVSGWYINGVDSRVLINDTSLFAAGVWAHHVLQWAQSGETVGPVVAWYVDTVLAGSISVAFTVPTGMDEWRIGADPFSSVAADGDIAEFGRWDHVLSATHHTRLAEGWRPNASIDSLSNGLIEYVPILGDDSPEPELIAAANMAVVGNPAKADHPTLLSGTNLKTINGLALASVKTVNGVPIASVKSWGGIT